MIYKKQFLLGLASPTIALSLFLKILDQFYVGAFSANSEFEITSLKLEFKIK